MAADRFWSKVAIGAEDDCWIWSAARRQSGYGLFYGRREKRWLRAHRVAWELAHGSIPAELFVLHSCDNRACVNPAHLFVGTQADNVHDMDEKDRRVSNVPRGENHWTRSRFAGMTAAERFWTFVDRSDSDGCWEWPKGDPQAGGYGRYWEPDRKRLILAHRYAWQLEAGRLAPGQLVAHVCGNRLCVNPAHLYAGTLAEFFRAHPDRKPTYARRVGAKNPAAKLDATKVRAIRRRFGAGVTVAKLAADYSVSSVSVRNVIRRKTWAHVD